MNDTNTLPDVKAKITWMNEDPTATKKAAASIIIGNAFQVHGICILEGSKGLFISMPQRTKEKNGEKQFNEVAHPITSEMRKAIHDAVFKAYSQTMAISQQYKSNIDKQKNADTPAARSDEPAEISADSSENSSTDSSSEESDNQEESCGVIMGQVM